MSSMAKSNVTRDLLVVFIDKNSPQGTLEAGCVPKAGIEPARV